MLPKLAALLCVLLTVSACPDDREAPRKKPAKVKARSGRAKRQLASLPYVNWVPVRPQDRNLKGVTRHNPDRAYKGITLFNSMPRAQARLIDMYGRTLHRWASPRGQPTDEELEWHRIWSHLDFIGWQQVEATRSGELFAILHMHGLLKLARDSSVQWLAALGAHHDLDVAASGEVFVLVADKVKLRHRKHTLRVLDDLVVILSPDGKERRRISLLQALRRNKVTSVLLQKKLDWAAPHFAGGFAMEQLVAAVMQKNKENLKRTARAMGQILTDRFEGSPRIRRMLMTSLLPMDPLHANSLQLLPRDVDGLGKKGDLLISVRELDLVLVLDPGSGKIGWTYGPGVLQRQHHPTVLESGNVLIYDNGTFAKRTRILEVDPRSKKIVWSYQAKPPRAFFSPIRGGCQRLPNGNTLIVESERGRAFEVLPDGELVWELFNPDLRDPFMKRVRAPIYRMTRFPPDHFTWLDTTKTGRKP